MNESTELNVVDLAAVSGVIATLAGWLPGIAAALSIIWLVIRIVESDTTHAVIRSLTGREIKNWLKREKKEQADDSQEDNRP